MPKKKAAARRSLPPSPLRGERVLQRRHALGLTQTDVERESGIQQKFVSAIENSTGERHVYDFVLLALASGLKTSMDYLCGRTDDPSPPTQPKKPRAS